MADQAITALPKKTYSGSSQIAATDYLLGIDSAEGYQMLIQDLGEYIINRATASLAGSTQTLASAINALNSKHTLDSPLQKNHIFASTSKQLVIDRYSFDTSDNEYIQQVINTSGAVGTVQYMKKPSDGAETILGTFRMDTQAQIDTLNSKTKKNVTNLISGLEVSANGCYLFGTGLKQISLQLRSTGAISQDATIFSVPSEMAPADVTYTPIFIFDTNSTETIYPAIMSGVEVRIKKAIPSGKYLSLQILYY